MNVSNLYRKLKQILNDSNIALVNRGLNKGNSFNDIFDEIKKAGGVNRLPYYFQKNLVALLEDDFGNMVSIPTKDFFYYYNGFESVTIPDSVTSISDSVFAHCPNLTNVIIGNGVTLIGSYVFYDCPNLTNVIIGNSVTSIGGSAFENCTRLRSIVIPDSVTTIENAAFFNCRMLKDMYLKSTTPPILTTQNPIPSTTIIHVPIGSGDVYKSATNWALHSSQIVEYSEIN